MVTKAQQSFWRSRRLFVWALLAWLPAVVPSLAAALSPEEAAVSVPSDSESLPAAPPRRHEPRRPPQSGSVLHDGPGGRSAAQQPGISGDESQKVLVIACDQDNPPYTMLYPKSTPAGMFVDIWKLWAERTGRRIVFRFTNLGDSVASIKTGEADIHSGLFATDDRIPYMDFTGPFFESSSSIFFPVAHGQLFALEDLAGQKVGAIHGGATAAFLREHHPGLEVVTYKDPRAMIDSALAGDIRAIASETLGFFTLLGHHARAGDFNRLEKPLYMDKFVAAVARGRKDLLAEIEKGV